MIKSKLMEPRIRDGRFHKVPDGAFEDSVDVDDDDELDETLRAT